MLVILQKQRLADNPQKNWIRRAINTIETSWSDQTISKDATRVLLNKTYYT